MSLTLVYPGQRSARAAESGAEQATFVEGTVSDALCAVSSRAPVRELVREYSVRIQLSRHHSARSASPHWLLGLVLTNALQIMKIQF